MDKMKICNLQSLSIYLYYLDGIGAYPFFILNGYSERQP